MISHLGDLDVSEAHGTFYRRQEGRYSTRVCHPALVLVGNLTARSEERICCCRYENMRGGKQRRGEGLDGLEVADSDLFVAFHALSSIR
jgi:hypothetical protein